MNRKYGYIILFFLSFSACSYGQNVEMEEERIEIGSASEIAASIQTMLDQNDFPDEYAKSIFRVGVNEQGEVWKIKAINHPYNEMKEEELKSWLSNMIWSNLEGEQSFYLIVEIENKEVKVNYKKN